MDISLIMGGFQWVCIFTSFILSMKTVNKKQMPNYMKGFYFYPIVALISSTLTYSHDLFRIFNRNLLVEIYLYLVLFHLSFLSFFFYRVFSSKILRRILIIIYLVSFAAAFYQVRISITENRNTYGLPISNLTLIIFCLMYYYELLNKKNVYPLYKEPSFWIVTGIFICMGPVVLYYTIYDFLKINFIIEEYKPIFIIVGATYGTMHLFFIKGYLCAIRNN